MIGSIKVAQIVSIIFVIVGIFLFVYNIFKSSENDKRLYSEDMAKKEEESAIKYYRKRGDHYV